MAGSQHCKSIRNFEMKSALLDEGSLKFKKNVVDALGRIFTDEHDKVPLHATLGRKKLFKELISISVFFVFCVSLN